MNRLKRFVKYYIKGEYHCDTCPFGWEECGYEDADAGCYIYGDIRDSCRLLPPFRFLIGWGRRKKVRYIRNHEYDDFPEFMEKYDREQREVEISLQKWLNTYGYGIVHASQGKAVFPNGNLETLKEYDGIYSIASDCRDIFLPVKFEPLKTRWKNLIKDTWKRFLMIFKPYFCE